MVTRICFSDQQPMGTNNLRPPLKKVPVDRTRFSNQFATEKRQCWPVHKAEGCEMVRIMSSIKLKL